MLFFRQEEAHCPMVACRLKLDFLQLEKFSNTHAIGNASMFKRRFIRGKKFRKANP